MTDATVTPPPTAKPNAQPAPTPEHFSDRAREILRQIVETYVETGEPVGSRTLSKRSGMTLSPATIRNVMADLEDSGLLYALHTSAGRLPTDSGLRLFVDGLLEVGNLTRDERERIEGQCAATGRSLEDVLSEATEQLSGLASCAGVVTVPRREESYRHIEFVNLAPGRALVVMVTDTGAVENRLVSVPVGLSASVFWQAANYLNSRLAGRSLDDVRRQVEQELQAHSADLDELASRVVAAGIAAWSGEPDTRNLIVRGQARLLEDVNAVGDLERIRKLFGLLETKRDLLNLLDSTQKGEGVQIYIGAENMLFSQTGCSMIIAPYAKGDGRIIGAIGVVGPSRLNYARIIPLVDYTAKVLGRALGRDGPVAVRTER
ncbi:MAG: heat-inducible transcriptional repressor HrcA [Alphaproteobacteria bacterium]|nr:heat-inducible transcriptional repressor HrcA [Alphaproteobacteria bacterium]